MPVRFSTPSGMARTLDIGTSREVSLVSGVACQTGDRPPAKGADVEFCSIELIEGSPAELRVEGEVDLASADKLAAALDKALTTNADLVVDMGGVTFIDAAG